MNIRCTIKNREKYLSSLSKKKRDKYKKCAGKVSRFIENSIQTRRNRIKVTKKDMKCFNDNEKKIKEYVKKKCGTKRKEKKVERKEGRRDKRREQGEPVRGKS